MVIFLMLPPQSGGGEISLGVSKAMKASMHLSSDGGRVVRIASQSEVIRAIWFEHSPCVGATAGLRRNGKAHTHTNNRPDALHQGSQVI